LSYCNIIMDLFCEEEMCTASGVGREVTQFALPMGAAIIKKKNYLTQTWTCFVFLLQHNYGFVIWRRNVHCEFIAFSAICYLCFYYVSTIYLWGVKIWSCMSDFSAPYSKNTNWSPMLDLRWVMTLYLGEFNFELSICINIISIIHFLSKL